MWRVYVCSILFYIGFWAWAMHYQVLGAVTFSSVFYIIFEGIYEKIEEIKIRLELIQIQTKIKV